MKYAVVIVSLPGYAHSEAFREVAQTLAHGLEGLGHDVVISGETLHPGRRVILLGANLLARRQMAVASDSILYNLEQVAPDSPWFPEGLLALFRLLPVWDYSALNVAVLAGLGIAGVRHVPLGYAPALTRIAPAVEDIDVLFIGSVNERRKALLQKLRAAGLRVKVAFGLYGEERDCLIARARIVINIHFYEAHVFEIVRVSYLLANRRFVVSETGGDSGEEAVFASGVAFAPYEDLVATCLHYLDYPDERRRIAERGFATIAARNQTDILRAALIE